MNRPIALALMILCTIGFFWAAPYAGRLGDLWQDWTYPRKNVTVEFRDGTSVTGTMHRQWDGDATLVDAKGRARAVHRYAYKAMSLPVTGKGEPQSSWRATLPLSILFVVYAALLIGLWLYRSNADRSRGKGVGDATPSPAG